MTSVIPAMSARRDTADMKVVKALPVILSALLIGAHFLRSGNVTIVVLILCAPLLMLVRGRWPAWVLRVALAAAAFEWIRTAFTIAQERAAIGAPTTRMFVILGAVALFTLASCACLQSGPSPKRRPETRFV